MEQAVLVPRGSLLESLDEWFDGEHLIKSRETTNSLEVESSPAPILSELPAGPWGSASTGK
jgi:hypothetical protein